MEIIRRIRARRLVRDLYRAILGREPDPDGMQTYESLIRRIGAERAVRKMLRGFRRSAEYHARSEALAISYIDSEMAARGTELVDGGPVAHLASLGSFCLPGNIMQRHGLRRYSLPFDWIFSSPQMLIDCLTDDFAAFLDRRYYRSLGESRGKPAAEHELYLGKYGIPAVFAHRDPTRDEDYLYFTRCVARFRQLLRSRDPKLFLIMGRPNHDLQNGFPSVLEQLSRLTTRFVLLGIDVLDPTSHDQCALTRMAQIGAHSLYRYLPSAFHAVGSYFPDRTDDWNVLRPIYRYRLVLEESPSRKDEPYRQPASAVEEHTADRPAAQHAVE